MRDERLVILNDYLTESGGGLGTALGGLTMVEMLFRPVQAVPQPPGGEEEMGRRN